MAPSAIAQRRTHNMLLFQKLLNLRDGASPFTLLLDTLEQSARPVVREFMTRAKIAKSKIIFISFSTLKKPKLADVFIRANGKSLPTLRAEIMAHLPPPPTGPPQPEASSPRILLILDTLHPLSTQHASALPTFLSSLLHPSASLLAVYHLDIPLPSPTSLYAPNPLTTLTYLATSILTISSLSHVLTKKRFRDRSLPAPGFGLSENREGVVFGLKDGLMRGKEHGVVVEMEVRRKSGRGVRDVLVLCPSSSSSSILTPALAAAGKAKLPPPSTKIGAICLLDDWPGYAAPAELARFEGEEEDGEEEMESTFSLGLTEKQRRDREGVVLPYFDAQKGGTEGGRILYEMGREDDWDPEEDEI